MSAAIAPGDSLGHYKLLKRLGEGQFGQVWLVEDTSGGPGKAARQYAMKMEPTSILTPLLKYERNALAELEEYKVFGFPGIRDFFTSGGYTCMVMTALGISLDEVRRVLHTHRKLMSQKTLLQLTQQCIMRCRDLHKAGYIHRDIKPANIVMGRGSRAGLVYFVDFGLVRLWRDQRTHEPLPVTGTVKFKGTVLYASLRHHELQPCTRRDDIESLCYTLMHLYCKDLPWQVTVDEMKASVKAAKQKAIDHKRALIEDYKAYWRRNAGPEKLCKRAPPNWLSHMLVEAYNTPADAEPPYSSWYAGIIQLAEKYGVKMNFEWDWSRLV